MASIPTWKLYFYTIVASIGMFNFGYHLAELNALEAILTCTNEDPKPSFMGLPSCITSTSLGFIFTQAILPLGGVFGALITAKLTDQIGRKKTMLFLILPALVGGLALFFANHFAWLLVGRFFSGISTGGSCVIAPLYINEISPKEMRGKLGTFSALFLTIGLFFSSLISYFLVATPYWRFILGFSLVTTLVQFLCLPFVIETPGYFSLLLSKKESQFKMVGLWTFLTKKPYRASLCIVVLCQGLQQLSGINAYFAYSFTMINPILPGKANIFGLCISFFYILFNFIPGLLLERCGRRLLLLISAFSMATTAVLITIGDQLEPILALAAFVATLVVFTIGLSVIPFLYTGEVVEPEAFAAASSVAYVVNNLSSFLVLMVSPVALKYLKSYAFLIFSGILYVGGVLIYFTIPETKGQTPAQVVEKLRQEFPIRRLFGSSKKTGPQLT